MQCESLSRVGVGRMPRRVLSILPLAAVLLSLLTAGQAAAWHQSPQPAVTAPVKEPGLSPQPAPAAPRPHLEPTEPIKPQPLPMNVPILAEQPDGLRSVVRPAQPSTLPSTPTLADAPQTPTVAPPAPVAEISQDQETAKATQGIVVQADPAIFRGIQPGTSTLADLAKAWGAPLRGVTEEGETFNTYEIEPFKQVDVALKGETVASIVITLKGPVTSTKMAEQLNFDVARSTMVADERGKPLGQAFPERGVLFLFAPSEQDSPPVAQVIIEPPSAAAFVARARLHRSLRYGESLADLDFALKLDPNSARAHALRARVLLDVGRIDEARTAIDEALLIAPGAAEYLLTRVDVLRAAGSFKKASDSLRTLLAIVNLPSVLKARAACLQGDLLTHSPGGSFQTAIKHHLQAIKLAQPLATSQQTKVRRAAKRVLVEAHLGVARDIAWGNWKDKQRVVPKWLDRASAFAENLIEKDEGDEQLRLAVMQAALSACVATKGQLDPSPWTSDALALSRKMISDSTSPLRRRRIQWLLSQLLHDAVRIAHSQGKYDQALKLGELAVEQFEAGTVGRTPTPPLVRMEGQLHYRIGLVHAVGRNDHVAAVQWYDRAISLLESQVRESDETDAAVRGETLVSVGVSYWKTGQQRRALRLSEQGRKLMETAVTAGTMDRTSLGIPYANLAFMHRSLGQQGEADNFQQMARKVKAADTSLRR